MALNQLSLKQQRVFAISNKVSEKPVQLITNGDMFTDKKGNDRQIQPGRCYDFAGTNEYIEIPDNDVYSFDGTTDQPFSISVWIYMDDATNFRIASKDNGSSAREWIFITDSSDKIKLLLKTGTNFIGRRYDTGLLGYQSEWIHVTATYSGSETNAGIKIYLNGIQIDDLDEDSGSYSGMVNTNQPVYIGQYGGAYVDGKMHDVRIHSKELSRDEVINVMNGASSGSEVGWWKLEENDGLIAYDSSRIQNHGDHQGTATLPAIDTGVSRSFSNEEGYNTVLEYNGTSAYSVIVEDAASDFNPGTEDFTIEALVNVPDVSDTGNYVWHKEQDGNNTHSLRMSNNDLFFYTADTSVLIINAGANECLNGLDNTWIHIAFVADRDGGGQFYINGSEITMDSNVMNAGDISIDGDFYIGRGTSAYFDGMIAEIRYSNIARTKEEIYNSYNDGMEIDSDTVSFFKSDSYGNMIDMANDHDMTSIDTANINIPLGAYGKDAIGSVLRYDGRVKYNTLLSSNCGNFDGSDDYIDMGDHDNFSFGDGSTDSPFSVSAWINMDDATGFAIVGKGRESDNPEWNFFTGQDLAEGEDDKLYFVIRSSSSNNIGRKTAVLTAYEGEWVCVVGTYDGSETIGGLKVYVNGVRVDTDDEINGTYVGMDNKSASAWIGYGLISQYADGKICDVRIHNAELTQSEIVSVMNGGVSGYEVGWYPLAEENGETSFDVSGNGYHGSIENATLSTFWGQTQNKFHYNLKGFSDALYFDGTAYGSLAGADAGDFNFGDGSTDSSFSVEAIIYMNDASSFPIAEKGELLTDGEWDFYTLGTDNLVFHCYDDSTDKYIGRQTAALTSYENQTIHVAATYDGSGESSGIKIYVNGIVSDTSDHEDTPSSYTAMEALTGELNIGFHSYGVSYAYGNIYSVRISSKARSSDEIWRAHNSGFFVDVNTVALWDFRNGEGVDAASVNGNDLILTNTEYIRVPVSDDVTKDAVGYPIQHKGGLWHNGAETIIDFTGGVSSPQINNIYEGYGEFNGSTSFVDCEDKDEFSFGDGSTDSPFSASAWINMNDATGFPIVGKGSYNDNPEWNVFVGKGADEGEDDKLYFKVRDSIPIYIGRKTDIITVYEGEWIHIAVTYDGSSLVGGLKIYINGIRSDVADDTNGAYVAMEPLLQPLWIGFGMTSTYADGKIRDVRLHRSELSAEQVARLYNYGTAGDDPIFYLPLYKDAFDYSTPSVLGTGHHGTTTDVTFPKITVPTAYSFGDGLDRPMYKRVIDNPTFESSASNSRWSSRFNGAYGVWEFDWLKDLGGNQIDFAFISDKKDTYGTVYSYGYRAMLSSGENFRLYRMDDSTYASLMTTTNSTFDLDAWYNIKISRNSVTDEYVSGAVGTFAIYIDGVLATANTGSNPVTDNTYTSSGFMVIHMDLGDKIRNLKFNGNLINYSKFRLDSGSYYVQGDRENNFAMFERETMAAMDLNAIHRYTKTE